MPQESEPKRTHQSDLELLQQASLAWVTRDFSQPAIRIDIVNRLCLKYLGTEETKPDAKAWLEHHYPMVVGACFNELHTHAYNYAKKMQLSCDKAEDIAQDCIRELLQTTNNVKNLKAWLARVAHNKAVALFNSQNRDQKLLAEVAATQELPHDPDEEYLWKMFTPEKVKQLLGKSDYRLYRELSAANSLKAYALEKGISYQTAKEHRHRLKVNLRSAYLIEQGWRDSQAILDFRQLRSIKRFVAKITNHCSKLPERLSRKVQDAFSDCTGIMTWDISMLGSNRFKLYIMIKTSTLPTMVRLEIKLNRMNSISVGMCKRGTLIATIPSGDTPILVADKCKGKIDYTNLVRLKSQATVYDQEEFDKMLEEYKDR